MKQVYERHGPRIKVPWGCESKMARKLKIGTKAVGKILDGQKSSKWQFEYSFEEIRCMAIEKYGGVIQL